jgi:hypothetical protein
MEPNAIAGIVFAIVVIAGFVFFMFGTKKKAAESVSESHWHDEPHNVAQATLDSASNAIRVAAEVHKPDAQDHVKAGSVALVESAKRVLESVPHAVESVKEAFHRDRERGD